MAAPTREAPTFRCGAMIPVSITVRYRAMRQQALALTRCTLIHRGALATVTVPKNILVRSKLINGRIQL